MNFKELNKERKILIEKLKYGLEYLNLKPSNDLETPIGRVNANLYYPLKEEEIIQFQNADGNELEAKASRVNSSAALLLNIFTQLRRDGKIDLKGFGKFDSYELETQLQVLNGGGKKANIDLSLTNDQSYIYIESKFTELFYYRKKKPTSLSYQIESKYPSKDIYQAAIQFLDKYKVYDVNQLVKHTIGIYRDCLNYPSKYNGKKVYLMNLNWELKTSVKNLYESYKLQIEAIKEATKFCREFNKIMKKCFKKIEVDFKFIYMNYYDFYKRVIKKDTDLFLENYLNQRYFSLQRKKLSTDDAVDYLEAHLDDDVLKVQFREMIEEFNIIHLSEYTNNLNNDIELDKRFTEFLDAFISISYVDKKIPMLIGEYKLDEYMHIHSVSYYNKTTVIYLSKVLPKIEKVIII